MDKNKQDFTRPEPFLETTRDKALRALQEIEEGGLYEIDRICRKYNINYSLGGGTCLGQYRHGGFIPWDDDIDVDMLVEDFERFIEVAPKELEGTDYFLCYNTTDSRYMRPWARVEAKQTSLNMKWNTLENVNTSVFVDIFCWTYLPDNKYLRKPWTTALFILRASMIYKHTGGNIGSYTPKHARKPVQFLGKYVPYKALRKVENYMNHKYDKTGWFMENAVGKGIIRGYPVQDLDEYVDVDFNGITVRNKKDPDTFLRTLYGNHYNEWLPPLKRVSDHLWHHVDLGKYAEPYDLPANYSETLTTEYSVEKLRLMKQLSLNMVDIVDEICQENGLRYYLIGIDSVLHAVEHDELGDVWREPLTVIMTPEDYEVFQQMAPARLGQKYFLQTHASDPEYHRPHSRICLNNTVLFEFEIPSALWYSYNMGLSINVVPLIRTTDNEKKRNEHYRDIKLLLRLLRFNWMDGWRKTPTLKRKAKSVAIKAIPMPLIYKLLDVEIARFKDEKSGYYINPQGRTKNGLSNVIRQETLGAGERCDYCGHSVVFPSDCVAFTREQYPKYEPTVINGDSVKITKHKTAGVFEMLISPECTLEERDFIREDYPGCMLNFYDLPDNQLTILRYDEKTGRLLSNKEIMGFE